MASITLRFLVEPGHAGASGRVHAGTVMKWIDDAGHACASSWARSGCKTVYTSSIRFQRTVKVGDLVEVRARMAFTGETNMNIGVEVRGGDVTDGRMEKIAECLVVMIALDTEGRPMLVNSWTPETPGEMALASSARAQFESTRPAPLE